MKDAAWEERRAAHYPGADLSVDMINKQRPMHIAKKILTGQLGPRGESKAKKHVDDQFLTSVATLPRELQKNIAGYMGRPDNWGEYQAKLELTHGPNAMARDYQTFITEGFKDLSRLGDKAYIEHINEYKDLRREKHNSKK